MKVVIADDDRALVHTLGAEFRSREWTVVQAFDAMQALMFTKRDPLPDLVVLDLGMPGGSGFGVLEKLSRSAKTSAIPVLVVTGSQEEEAKDRARSWGAVGFLTKPVEPSELVDVAEEILGLSSD